MEDAHDDTLSDRSSMQSLISLSISDAEENEESVRTTQEELLKGAESWDHCFKGACSFNMSKISVVLLGNTAVGKSASGNTILGRSAFASKSSLKPVTTKICEDSESVCGLQLSVVDTPGILKHSDEIKQFCEDLLRGPGPTVFLVVLKVDRVSSDQVKALEKVMEILGSEGMRRSLLLFTHGAALEGQALHDFISEDDEGPLPDIYSMFGQRHQVFDNVSWSQKNQIPQLLQKINQLNSEISVASDLQQVTLGPSVKQMRLVLLGLPGAGKSSTGNSILRLKQDDQFKTSCGFDAMSAQAELKTADVLDRSVSVVDTPGLTYEGGKRKQKKLFKNMMKTVLELAQGPHAFIIVVRIGRVGERELSLLKLIPIMFDQVASKFIMVLFTHGDSLEGEDIDSLIEQKSNMKALVEQCGKRYTVFNNKSKAVLQIEQLFKMIDTMVEASGEDHCNSHIFKLTTAEEIKERFEKIWAQIQEFFKRKSRNPQNTAEEIPLLQTEDTSPKTHQD